MHRHTAGTQDVASTTAVEAVLKRAGGDRDRLLERFNRAVRRPESFGGLAGLGVLLDQIARTEQQSVDTVWIPDTNARLSPSTMLREFFADPDIHVAASQYGEDAYRRGWLCLDRALTPEEHAVLVDAAVMWARTDRTVHDIVAEFGPASVTFGDPDPRRPKTLSYGSDRNAPVVAFHLGPARAGTIPSSERSPVVGAPLLGVRVCDDFPGRWELTPYGEAFLEAEPE